MKDDDLKRRIQGALEALEDNCFSDNELAYLALTSKVEQPIRDRLAFALYGAIGEECVVSREWAKPRSKKRID